MKIKSMVPMVIHLFLLLQLIVINGQVEATSKPGDDEHLHESQIPAPIYDNENELNSQQPTPEDIQTELSHLYIKYDLDGDGQLSVEEIKNWLDAIHVEITKENLDRQWAFYEPILQEVHSWHEYKPTELEVIDWEKYKNKTFTEELMAESLSNPEDKTVWETMLTRAIKRWEVADSNNDTILTKEEFKDFMWPEESKSEVVKERLVEEGLEDMDTDGDSKISMDEYMKHLISITAETDRAEPEWSEVQKNHFITNLDKDKDGFLNPKELEYWLTVQTERHNEEAVRLVASADANKDQFLSVDEMMESYNNFFTLIPPKFWNTYYPEEALFGATGSHDEL